MTYSPTSLSPGSGSDSSEVLRGKIEVPQFVREARETWESLTGPDSIPGKVISFLSESVRKLKEEGPAKMLLFWLESAMPKLKRRLDQLRDMMQDSWLGKLFGLGEELREDLEGQHGRTALAVLGVVFGGSLAAGHLDTIGRLFGDDVSELIAAKDNPNAMAELLRRRVAEGAGNVTDEQLGSLRNALGLPPLSEVVEQGREVIAASAEALRDFDERSGLKALRERLGAYLDREHPGWRDHPSMAWVHRLNQPADVAEALGVDPEKPETWENVLRIGVAGGGLAAGFVLLRRLFGLNTNTSAKIIGAVTVNLALYSFLKNEGVHDRVLGGLERFREFEEGAFETVYQNIEKFLLPFALEVEDLGLPALPGRDFTVTGGIEYLAQLSHEHPELSLVAINTAFLTRHIWIAVLNSFFTLAAGAASSSIKLTGRAALWVRKHPAEAFLVGAYAGLAMAKRRELITDLAQDIYPHDAGARQEFLDAASRYFGIDFEAEETFVEKTADPFYKALIENPKECLRDGELRLKIFEEMESGDLLWFIDNSLGKLAVGIVVHGNPMWHVINLELGAVESLLMEFENITDASEDFNVYAATALAAEGYVFGKAGIGVKKGYVALLDPRIEGRAAASRFFKTILPFTKENWHLWRSMLREVGDSVPLFKATDFIHGRRIAHVSSYARELLELAEAVPPRIDDVTDRLRLIKKWTPDVKVGQYEFLDDFEINRSMRQIHTICADIEEALLKDEAAGARAPRLLRKLDEVSSRWSRLLNIGIYVKDGNIKGAVKEIMRGPGVQALEVDQIFKGRSHSQLRTRISDIDTELSKLDDAADLDRITELRRERRAIEAFIDPTINLQRPSLSNIRRPEMRALEVERMALEMESVERGVSARVTSEIETIMEDAKRSGLSVRAPEIQARLTKIDETMIIPFWKQKQGYLKELSKHYRRLPARFRTARLKAVMNQAHESTYLTKVTKGVKGRAVVVVALASLMVATDILFQKEDSERELDELLSELGPDVAQLLVDVLPGVGTYSVYRTAVTGQEWVSGREMEGWARWSNYIWGTVSLAADALTVLAFVPSGSLSLEANVGGRLALMAARGSTKAKKLSAAWPRITKLAEKLGGWDELLRAAHRFLKHADESSRMVKGLKTAQGVGLASGLAVTAGGLTYDLVYAQEDGDTGFEMASDIASQMDESFESVMGTPPPDADIEYLPQAA